MYQQYVPRAIVDGSPRPIFTQLNAQSVILKVPFFWTDVLIDPSYSLLVSTKEKKTPAWIYGAAVAGVGILAVSMAAVVGYSQHKRHKEIRAIWKRAEAILKKSKEEGQENKLESGVAIKAENAASGAKM